MGSHSCQHGHSKQPECTIAIMDMFIAALAHQMFCVLTNSDHLAIMVTTSSLIETADSERLQSSADLNVACYCSIGLPSAIMKQQKTGILRRLPKKGTETKG
jgi:hypothetical protein